MAAFNVTLADVGDGMCAFVGSRFDFDLVVDCGSLHNPSRAYAGLRRVSWRRVGARNESAFLLSHFHADHYNGLVYAEAWLAGRRPPRLMNGIDSVFYPGQPTFPEKGLDFDFRLALFVTNDYVLGSRSGVPAFDLISIVRRLNGEYKFSYRPLYQGDQFCLNGRRFDVLWPPHSIDDESTTKAVRDAVSAFDEAVKKNRRLAAIREWFQENRIIDRYEDPNSMVGDSPAGRSDTRQSESRANRIFIGELEPEVRHANELLRKAANRLCLAFHYDDRILALGDLEDADIGRVVRRLDRTKFDVILAAHHGTHWHNDLRSITADSVLVSNGQQRVCDFDVRWKEIGRRVLATHINGDIAHLQPNLLGIPGSESWPPWEGRLY